MDIGEMISYLVEQWRSYPRPSERLISAIGIDIHWTILQYVMGLPFMAFIAQLIYMKTRDRFWLELARTLVKGFVIIFAVGAATGTTAEFGLILLWPRFTEVGGRYIFFPFYAEVYAFMIEVIFVYFLYYGWNKVGDKVRLILTMLVFLGAWYSGAMIMAVNSYMVTPTGLEPAYTPDTGYLYNEGYPKIEVVLPGNISSILDPEKLTANGIGIRIENGTIIAEIPARILYRLFWEASNGYTLNQSILADMVEKEYVGNLTSVSVAKIVNSILDETVKHHDPLLYPFKSPSWAPSVLHVTGAALAVSGYTVAGAYALRMARSRGEDEYYRSYRALRFAVVYTLIVMAVQGIIFGHEMGVTVAHYNPEKFAAMEGTSMRIFSITRNLTGGLGEKLASLLAYGNPDAGIPEYDKIPRDWCSFPGSPVSDCRPPLLIHYAYYLKISLSMALGIFTLAEAYRLWRGRSIGKYGLYGFILSPLIAQSISFLGWFVREAGRKPFTVYGMFTPAEAGNPAGVDMTSLALVGVYLIAMLVVLAWAVYKFLWRR